MKKMILKLKSVHMTKKRPDIVEQRQIFRIQHREVKRWKI